MLTFIEVLRSARHHTDLIEATLHDKRGRTFTAIGSSGARPVLT
jgi:hypothetical protein